MFCSDEHAISHNYIINCNKKIITVPANYVYRSASPVKFSRGRNINSDGINGAYGSQ